MFENRPSLFINDSNETYKCVAPVIAPQVVVVDFVLDKSPVFLRTFSFYKHEDTRLLNLIQPLQDNATIVEESFPGMAKKSFAEYLGDFLASKKFVDAQHSECANDVAILSRHCAISSRKPRIGENAHSVTDLTLDAQGVRDENTETWSRFIDATENVFSHMYTRKCDVPRDVVIPK